MHLTKRRWTLLGEEVAGMLRSRPELDAEVMRGLIHKLREWDNKENAKEQLWGVAVAKTLAPLRLMPPELEGLSLEEHALILASFRVVARTWEEGAQPSASEDH
ncbi:MAG: hypothetical protein HY681_02470 [Chloroflexi bacterium]|nr:hypothetical protein [Chloroflexota bacterium]